MAACGDCNQEMTSEVGCTAFPGREPVSGDTRCHDCWAPVGGMHHPGCDNERCDHGNQAIGGCDRCEDYMHLAGCPRATLVGGEWLECGGCAPEPLDYWQRVSGAIN